MASIRLEIDDLDYLQALQGWERLAQNPDDMYVDIGEHLQLSTGERFDRRVTPDGKPWPAVSEEYAERKRAGKATKRSGAIRDPAQILQLTRDMRRLTRSVIDSDGLHFGSDREYAAAQNLGSPKQNLPARQWLGLSSDDDEAIEDIAKHHLQMVAGLE